MADLDAQIRAKLTEMRHNAQKRGIDADEERDPRLAKVAADAEDLAGAVLALLDAGLATRQADAIAKALGIVVGE